MTAFQSILSKLSAHGSMVTMQKGGKAALAQCPAHDDNKQSLSVGQNHKGDALLNCFAGCATPDVVAALGLPMSALFEGGVAEATGEVYYDYKDEDGNLLNQVVRTVPKGFRQRRPDGNGGWVWNLEGVRRVMYRLPDIQGKRALLLVEGEKDVDNLWAIKIPATTTLGGSSAWKPEFAEQLAESGCKRLGILPDNDEPGRKYALAVARDCHEAGIDVSIIQLPGLPEKGDVSEFLAAAKHPRGDLIRAIQGHIEFPTAPLGDDAPLAAALEGVKLWEPGQELRRKSRWRKGTDLDATPITYLVDKMIPKGMLGSISGRDKRGKSLLGLEIAKAVLTGQPLFNEFVVNNGQPGKVFMVLLDDPEFVIRDRLTKLGIVDHPNLRVMTRNDVPEVIEQGKSIEFLKGLAAEMKEEQPAFLLIDALYMLIPNEGKGGDPQNSGGVMKPIMQALDEVANVSPATTVGIVIHHNKANSDLAGSATIRQMLKWILMLDIPKKYDKDVRAGRITPDRILQLDKLKTGVSQEWGLRIVGAPDGHVQWEMVDISELEKSDKKRDRAERRKELVEWLRFFLEPGPRTTNEVSDAAKEAGFKQRELNSPDTADAAGVEKVHPDPQGPWLWKLKEA